MNSTRQLVLQSFKKLHRTRVKVFAGDESALIAARIKINESFTSNKKVSDVDAIKAMIKYAEDVENELRTQVIQAREIKPGVFGFRQPQVLARVDNALAAMRQSHFTRS